jgi:hypothetical protein
VYMQGVLVANRRSLTERPAQLLPVVHELLERLDAHLKAEDFYSGERLCSGLGSRVQFLCNPKTQPLAAEKYAYCCTGSRAVASTLPFCGLVAYAMCCLAGRPW